MKPAQAKAIYKDCINRGYVEDNNVLYPPNSKEAERLRSRTAHSTKKSKSRSQGLKTGWIDDTRNIRNKSNQTDMFMRLVKLELDLEVWPEFYFSTDRKYRFDYAIPVNSPNPSSLKIAIEVDGGIYAKGNSGHSSGKGIKRDMDKSTLANVNGWTLIRCTPQEIKKEPGKIIELIKKAIGNA